MLWLVLRGPSRSFIIGWQKMIYIHSLGQACRYYTQPTTLVVDGAVVSFKALHERVQNNMAALAVNGLKKRMSRESKEVDGEKIYR